VSGGRTRTHRSDDRFAARSCVRSGQASEAWLGRAEIGQLTDVVTGSGRHDQTVVITIRFDAVDPPAGRLWLSGRPEVTFVGWLGLLRALSELLQTSGP
jgi:hypothetical protein